MMQSLIELDARGGTRYVESVELIASDYEWTCPDCETLNHEIEINEWVTCKECDHEYRVNEYHHAIG